MSLATEIGDIINQTVTGTLKDLGLAVDMTYKVSTENAQTPETGASNLTYADKSVTGVPGAEKRVDDNDGFTGIEMKITCAKVEFDGLSIAPKLGDYFDVSSVAWMIHDWVIDPVGASYEFTCRRY